MSTFSVFSQSAPVSTRSAADRYFEISLYLLIVCGFVSLAGTGQLDFLSIFVVSTALLLRGRQLLKGDTSILSDQWTARLTIGYAIFWFLDFFVLSRSFVTSTVHMLLFATLVRMFSVQQHRHHLQLMGLAFGAVLASALWTVDTIFLATFAVFLLLAVATLITLEMKRSAESATGSARESAANRQMGGWLSGTSVALVLAILVGATVLFFILPRVQTRYLSAFAPRNDLVTGFSDDVKLGDIGEIKRSHQVVMHIQIDGDTRGAFDLKWRGIALSTFDGIKWSNPPGYRPLHFSNEGGFDLSRADTTMPTIGYRPVKYLRYRVLMEPIGTDVFFFAPRAQALYGPYREVSTDGAGSVFNKDVLRMISSYRAVSNVYEPPVAQLQKSNGTYPPDVTVTYLQLPGGSVDPRVHKLAVDVTSSKTNNFDKTEAIEEFLRANYGYTLTLPRTVPKDPIANFLLERKEGHCEYFASAMTVMLRSLGIPARVVNGFRTGEFNTITGSYIIRASDAHSWVEVFFPGNGWITFDPTPADPKIDETSTWARIGLYMDAAREFWREWIINYDFQHQEAVSASVVSRGRVSFDRARLWIRTHYYELVARARRTSNQVNADPGKYGGRIVGVVVLLLLAVNSRRAWRAFRDSRMARRPDRAPQVAASIWYARMTRRLARSGWRKLETQTPAEFVVTIEDARLRSAVEEFTRRYERARFGDSIDDARALPELYEEISRPR